MPVKSVTTPNPPARQWPRYTFRSPRPPAEGDRVKAYPDFEDGLRSQRNRLWSVAIAFYRKALELDPAFFEAQYNLGLAELEAGDANRATEAFEIAAALRPDSTEARYYFATSLKKAGFPPDAAQQLETLLATKKNETRAHLAIAKLYAEDLSRLDLAREHYRRVLELDPKHPQALEIGNWLVRHPD